MKKSRAIVTISDRAISKGPRKLWGYSYEDLAALLKVHVVTVRRLVAEKMFDPADLKNIVQYAFLHRRLTATWTNVRRSDVARDIAHRAGFDPERVDVDDTSEIIETITVENVTAGRFLARMAAREKHATGIAWEATTGGGVFRFKKVGAPSQTGGTGEPQLTA